VRRSGVLRDKRQLEVVDGLVGKQSADQRSPNPGRARDFGIRLFIDERDARLNSWLYRIAYNASVDTLRYE
jgi:hypothetical protein